MAGGIDLAVKPVSVRTPHLTVAGRYPERSPARTCSGGEGVRTFLPASTCTGGAVAPLLLGNFILPNKNFLSNFCISPLFSG